MCTFDLSYQLSLSLQLYMNHQGQACCHKTHIALSLQFLYPLFCSSLFFIHNSPTMDAFFCQQHHTNFFLDNSPINIEMSFNPHPHQIGGGGEQSNASSCFPSRSNSPTSSLEKKRKQSDGSNCCLSTDQSKVIYIHSPIFLCYFMLFLFWVFLNSFFFLFFFLVVRVLSGVLRVGERKLTRRRRPKQRKQLRPQMRRCHLYGIFM